MPWVWFRRVSLCCQNIDIVGYIGAAKRKLGEDLYRMYERGCVVMDFCHWAGCGGSGRVGVRDNIVESHGGIGEVSRAIDLPDAAIYPWRLPILMNVNIEKKQLALLRFRQ